MLLDSTKNTTLSGLFKQISSPTIVNHSLFCNVLHPTNRNLVLIRGTNVEIYDIIKTDSDVKFNFLASSSLYEEVEDAVVVRFYGDQMDSLLLSFQEAKVAAMNFDIHTYELKTCSLHTYELPSLKGGRLQFTKPPFLRVDPLQRCAVMLVYDRFLAVLPFRRADALKSSEYIVAANSLTPTVDAAWQHKATAPILSSFTTFLSTSTGERINNVIDIQFLYGFYEPTLLVLYEPIGTWAGRVSARRDTCCIVALSLNLQKRTNPVIWFQELLPYDCHTVLPIPMPVGGIILIGSNSIIYLKQTLPSCGLPLNCYAKTSTNFPLRQAVPECGPLSLDSARAALLSTSQILITSRTGAFYILTLWLEKATNTVNNLILSEAGNFVPAESITLLDENRLFIGSCLADSLLLRFRLTTKCFSFATPKKTLPEELSLADVINKSKLKEEIAPDSEIKRSRLESTSKSIDIATNHEQKTEVTIETMEETSVMETMTKKEERPLVANKALAPSIVDEIDLELYGPNVLQPFSHSLNINEYHFEVIDRLANIGPMASITVGEVPCLATGQTDPSDEALTAAQSEMAHVELIAAIARPSTDAQVGGSSIVMLHRSVRARGLTAFELPEYNSLWSLYGPPVGTFGDKLQSISPNETPNTVTFNLESPLTVMDNWTTNGVKEGENKENAAVSGNIAEETATENVHPTSPKPTEDISPEVVAMSTGDEMDTQVTLIDDSKSLMDHFHSYLLLTREDSTMILEVGEEIVELEVSGFKTTETTIVAANLGLVAMRLAASAMAKGSTNIAPSSPVRQIGEVDELLVGKDYPYILQVSPTSLRLLDGPHLLEDLQLTTEWRVYLVSVSDPYVLVGTEDDDLILVALRPSAVVASKDGGDRQKQRLLLDDDPNDQEDNLPSSRFLQLKRPKVGQVSAPLCFCLFHDVGGRLSRWLNFNHEHDANLIWVPKDTNKANNVDVDGMVQRLSALDEEDILLYGEVIDVCKKESFSTHQPMDQATIQTGSQNASFVADTGSDVEAYFAFIVFSNGVLEIYSVPDFTCLFEVHHFSNLPSMLFDNRFEEDKPVTKQPKIASLLADVDDLPPTICEIAVYSMGYNKNRPILFVRTNQEVVCYEALCAKPDEAAPLTPFNIPPAHSMSSISPLRWRRLPVPCPLLAPRRLRSDPRITDIQTKLTSKSTMLRPFEDIGGHRGVFVCGSQPMWLFCSRMGHLRVFPHTIDGVMTSFAPLNTSACPKGFVYFTHANEMRLATLPPGCSYEGELGMNSITLDSRPHFVQYHLESKTYVVVSSFEATCTAVVRLNAEGNKEEEDVDRPTSCVFPKLDTYKLSVISAPPFDLDKAPQYQVVPNSVIEFEPFEVVTCLITAQLISEQTIQGTKDYLALGSNFSYGEEIPVRGRIMLVDIIEVVPEPGKPLTRHKVKIVFDGDQKGPVTALASCQGHLISAVGQKIYIWTLKNGDLVGVAFVDTELYIHSLLCVKNLVLAADVLKSIQLLRFQASMRVLSLVSRDSATREVFAANFFIDGVKLGFLITDKLGNLVVYSYDPLEMSSCSGRRLVQRLDMRLPSRATACLRIGNRFRHPLLSTKALSNASTNSNSHHHQLHKTSVAATSSLLASFDLERTRQSVYFGSQTGAIFLISPIRDKMFSRFRIIEKNLVQCVGAVAGLTPRACRQYNNPSPELENPCGNVADGDLIWRYLTLPHAQRLEVAKKSGQNLDSILDDIAEVSAITLHF